MSRSQKYDTKLIEMAGERFGRLVVITRAPTPSHVSNQGRAYWECLCDCGKTAIIAGKNLRNAKTRSCGCLHVEVRDTKAVKHGHARPSSHTRTYNSWQSMRRRCLLETDSNYAKYGGRGITICARWDLFETFLSDMGVRPEGMTLDRYPDVNGNYEPGNCRWATPSQQSANTRRALIYEIEGKRMNLKEWSEHLGISYKTLRNRIRVRGWSPVRALTTPVSTDRSKQCQ